MRCAERHNLAERHASQRAIGGEREILRDAQSGPSLVRRLASVLLAASTCFSCDKREERAGTSEPVRLCNASSAANSALSRARAATPRAASHEQRLPASPERCSMQPVASVRAALDQPVSASATSRLRPKNAPKRPMTTILFTRPNIHRVDRSSAWLKLRGHTQKMRRDRDENTSLD